MHLIRKYFNDMKWIIDDLKQTQWSKHTDRDDWYFLGKQKNNEGKCINCNGLAINADWAYVIIGAFDEDGDITDPYI